MEGFHTVRSLAGEEITLPTWAAFSGEEILSEIATERIIGGMSSRRYRVGLEPVGVAGSGTSKSTLLVYQVTTDIPAVKVLYVKWSGQL